MLGLSHQFVYVFIMHENMHISINGAKNVQGTKLLFEKLRVGIVGYNQTWIPLKIYIALN